MNKSIAAFLLTGLAIPAQAATTVTDDFDSGFSGWSADVVYSAAAGSGIGGSGGLDYATTAISNRGAIHGTAVTGSGSGHTITISAWVQLSLNGTGIADATDPNVNGVNQEFFGMRASTTADWWNGTNVGFNMMRRDFDGIWGTGLPASPWQNGWNNNTELGFADNSGSAASSGWFQLELVLTDGGGANYDQLMNVYGTDGTTLAHTTGSFATGIAVGTPVYGGFWNGWDLGSNTVEQQSKINSVKIDNFSMVATPEPTSALLIGLGAFGLLRRRRR